MENFYDFRGISRPSGNIRRSGGSSKRCTKGKSCGATCIQKSKVCWVDLPGGRPGSNGGKNLHDATTKVKNLIQQKQGLQSNPQPQPQPQPQPTLTTKPKESESEKGLSSDVWKRASTSDDHSEIKKLTADWVKRHGFDNTIEGHDHGHVMMHSFLNTNSDILAKLAGGKKGDVSVLEEGLIYFFEQAGSARKLAKGKTPQQLREADNEEKRLVAAGFRPPSVPPSRTSAKLSKQEIANIIAPQMRGLAKPSANVGNVNPREQQNLERNIQRATNIIYKAQQKLDYFPFVDTMHKTRDAISSEAFQKLFK